MIDRLQGCGYGGSSSIETIQGIVPGEERCRAKTLKALKAQEDRNNQTIDYVVRGRTL